MRVATAIAKFLEEQGITHVFGVNGGANLWAIHGLADENKIKFIPNAEEKSASYAADAYARLTGLGCCLVTSGPGATGIITGIAASYQDSTPVLYIAGNCATFRKGSNFGVRNYGFQELDFVSMIKGVTKYSVQITEPNNILYELDYAVWMAQSGRKGPVVVDLPDDVQRMQVEYDSLPRYGR